MKNRIRGTRIALVAAAAALAMVGSVTAAAAQSTVPAGADVPSPAATVTPIATVAPTADADDPIVEQIMLETKVSRAEAITRTAVESRSGTLAGKAATAFGARWGGLTVGVDSSLTLHLVGITATDRNKVTALATSTGVPASRVRAVTAKFSVADLDAAAARVASAFATRYPTTGFSVTPSVAGGEVQLQVTTGASAIGAGFAKMTPRLSARVGGAQVPVRMTGEQEVGTSACAGKGKCDSPIRGGQHIVNNRDRCTGGFVARGRADHSKRFLVTAGHCTIFAGTWKGINSNGVAKPIGKSVKSTFRKGGDLGLIAITNKSVWKPSQNWVVVYKSGDTTRDLQYEITGVAASQVGQRVCHTGSTTGTRCGKVVAVGEHYRYCDPKQGCQRMVTIKDVTRATDRVIPGDSGGPRYANHQAYGITSGYAQTVVNGRKVYYSLAVEATAIQRSLNVELVTR